MRHLVIALMCVLNVPMAAACDLEAARRVRLMFTEMASVRHEGDKLKVYWRDDWDAANRTQRERLIRTFADADACLNARPREITFYRHTRVVGRATPGGGVRLTDN